VSAPGLVIAHAGANTLDALARAAEHADVVEADVHLFRGRLEVRHAKTIGPVRILWERWYLLPRDTPRVLLEDVLGAAGPRIRLMLDLKGYDPRLPGAVLRAAGDAARERGLIVSARAWRSADRLLGAPGVRALHSVGSARQLQRLLRRYRPGSLEGVSVHRRLLTPASAAALRERAPWLWTWPVDDPDDAAVLAGWGVTGFISDAPERLRDGAAPRRPGADQAGPPAGGSS
jgi:glycerophosphoryl diester phosphodiesterase